MRQVEAMEREPPVPDYVLGMVLCLAAEAMFFAGLISAFLVARANAAVWPPPGQPRLPVARTAANTALLLASAATMWRALRARRGSLSAGAVGRWLALTIGLGGAFLALQGYEWLRLIAFGLTTTSSLYGGFFYLIVGAHAAHVAAGLAWLLLVAGRFRSSEPRLGAAGLYWFFVAGLWPVLYALVYLA